VSRKRSSGFAGVGDVGEFCWWSFWWGLGIEETDAKSCSLRMLEREGMG
jgi:hypothetical protein